MVVNTKFSFGQGTMDVIVSFQQFLVELRNILNAKGNIDTTPERLSQLS